MLCLDQSEAAGIEAERFQPMAVKLTGGGEALRRGNDENRSRSAERSRERDKKTESCRQVFGYSGMDLMQAFERQTLPGQVSVERKPEGEEPALARAGKRRGQKLAQFL